MGSSRGRLICWPVAWAAVLNLAMASCAHEPTPTTAARAKRSDPNRILRLTIHQAETAARDTDGAVESSGSWFCVLLGAGAALATAATAGAALSTFSAVHSVCDTIEGASQGTSQRQRRPQAADLYVAIELADKFLYRSPTSWDSYVARFRHSILLPLPAVPPEGIRLWIMDDDKSAGAQELGSFRLDRARLLALEGRGLQRLADSGPNVGSLEIEIDSYDPPGASSVRIDAALGAATVPIAVPAGAVVSVISHPSEYQVRHGEPIGPAGSRRGGSNFPALEDAPHGAAFVAVGDGTETRWTPVPTCVELTGVPAGFIIVGVNDNGERKDNEGQLSFQIQVRLPTVQEWLHGYDVVDCVVE